MNVNINAWATKLMIMEILTMMVKQKAFFLVKTNKMIFL